VVSWAFRATTDVVAALFTGSGRLRGSAENKRRGLGVKPAVPAAPRSLQANGAVLGYRVDRVQGRVGPERKSLSGGVVPTRWPNPSLQPTSPLTRRRV
jgi:hypothetical protein